MQLNTIPKSSTWLNDEEIIALFDDEDAAFEFWCEETDFSGYDLQCAADIKEILVAGNNAMKEKGIALQFTQVRDNDDNLMWLVA